MTNFAIQETPALRRTVFDDIQVLRREKHNIYNAKKFRRFADRNSIDGDSLGFIFFQMHIDFMRAAVPLHHHPDMGFLPVKLDDFAVLAAAVRFCRTREI